MLTFNSTFDKFNDIFAGGTFGGATIVQSADKTSIVANVAGFKQGEIKVKVDNEVDDIIVECRGNSPYFGKAYRVRTSLPEGFDAENLKIKYEDGLVIISPRNGKLKEKVTELSFDDVLHD